MSVRVVARIRPLLKSEIERDQILTSNDGADSKPCIVKIPNPKNFAEEYSFQFSSVYGQDSVQQEIFEAEGGSLSYASRAGLTSYSRSNNQAPLSRLRCYDLRIWQYRDWEDAHDEGWQIIGRPRHDPKDALEHLSKEQSY